MKVSRSDEGPHAMKTSSAHQSHCPNTSAIAADMTMIGIFLGTPGEKLEVFFDELIPTSQNCTTSSIFCCSPRLSALHCIP